MKQFISWAIIKRLTESESILLKRGIEAHFRARLQPYSLWLSLKINKVAITHLAMEIHFQTSDHVVAVEIVAEQHIGTKLCSCNTFEDISHLLIMVIIKVAITQLAMELQL